MKDYSKLLVIVGETGAGKSALAIDLAKQFNGEIISADSRTVYKGMDIGTAKPTTEQQAAVRHHLLDVITPDQKFSAADFKKLANQAIEEISNRGKLPIMAGGSGLYIDSVLFDYKFRTPPANTRDYLNKKSLVELQLMVLERGLPMPANAKNPRHLIRTIETDGLISTKSELRPNTLLIGLETEREALRQRLEARTEAMLKAGLIDEVKRLAGQYGWQNEALQAPAYNALRGHIEDGESLEMARQKLLNNEMALAKRQRTWFRRNKSIHWFTTPVIWRDIVATVTTFLNK